MNDISISKFMYETLAGGFTNQLPISSVCNAKCIFCSNDMNPFAIFREGFRPLEDIKKGIHLLDPNSTADLRLGDSLPGRISEGEALLHPDIIEILQLVRNKIPNRIIQINTNGTLFTDEFVKDLSPFKPMKFTISYHSDNQENWCKIFNSSEKKYIIARNSFFKLKRERFIVEASFVPLPKLVGYDDIEKTLLALRFYVKNINAILPGYSKDATEEQRDLLDVDMHELSVLFTKWRKKYRWNIKVMPDLMKPLSFDPYKYMINSFNNKHKNVLWLFSQAAFEKGKAILDNFVPYVPNNHYAIEVKNFTYEGNIICSGLLMVEDFRKAIKTALNKLSKKNINIDLFVLPKLAFDRFGDDLTGENYAKLIDDFEIPVWLG